jgi:prepilin-type N-terminal cleavage/methylation domain-containing protein
MKRRQGFTLVELLVAMALIIFIMAILSQAFVAAMTTFRNLKAAGDMAEKLRAVTQLLQRDLSADHFDGKQRLSNPNFWLNGPPSQGYFRVWQSSNGTPEGADVDGIYTYRSTDHMLAFTVKQRGNDIGSFFTAGNLPPTFPTSLTATGANFGPLESRYQTATGALYNYQWAEVAWFMQPSINPSTGQPDTTPAGVPLYILCRRQCLLVPDNSLVVPAQSTTNVALSQVLELSAWQNQISGNWHFNSPIDITVPWQRFGMVPLSTFPAGLLYGVPTGPGTPAAPLPNYPIPIWPQGPNTGNWFAPSQTPPNPQTYYPPLPAPYQTPLIPYYPTMAQQAPGSPLSGADIQLNDVISFDVRLLVQGITPTGNDPFVTLLTPATTPLQPINVTTNPPVFLSYCNSNQAQNTGQAFNPAFSFLTGPMVFDTWTSVRDAINDYSTWNTASTAAAPNYTAIPLWNGSSGPIIQAVQISIRIWDYKTNQTRQVTMVQAM